MSVMAKPGEQTLSCRDTFACNTQNEWTLNHKCYEITAKADVKGSTVTSGVPC